MIEKGEKNFNDDEIIVQISSCKILFNVWINFFNI
jgi:hypothetical protein